MENTYILNNVSHAQPPWSTYGTFMYCIGIDMPDICIVLMCIGLNKLIGINWCYLIYTDS